MPSCREGLPGSREGETWWVGRGFQRREGGCEEQLTEGSRESEAARASVPVP